MRDTSDARHRCYARLVLRNETYRRENDPRTGRKDARRGRAGRSGVRRGEARQDMRGEKRRERWRENSRLARNGTRHGLPQRHCTRVLFTCTPCCVLYLPLARRWFLGVGETSENDEEREERCSSIHQDISRTTPDGTARGHFLFTDDDPAISFSSLFLFSLTFFSLSSFPFLFVLLLLPFYFSLFLLLFSSFRFTFL